MSELKIFCRWGRGGNSDNFLSALPKTDTWTLIQGQTNISACYHSWLPVDQFWLEYLRFFILNTQAWNMFFISELHPNKKNLGPLAWAEIVTDTFTIEAHRFFRVRSNIFPGFIIFFQVFAPKPPIFPGFPGLALFFQVFQVRWEPCSFL